MKPALLLLLCLSCFLLNCTIRKKKKAEPAGQMTLIGQIEMVNPEQNYVLIRCDQPPALMAGTKLSALGSDGQKAKLLLTPERKGYYLTADIEEGNPQVGNLVLLPQGDNAPSPVEPSPTPVKPAPVIPSGQVSRLQMPTLPSIPMNLPAVAPPSVPVTDPPKIDLGDLEPPVR